MSNLSKEELIAIIETHLRPQYMEWEDVGFGRGYRCPICKVETWKELVDLKHKPGCYWSK